MNHSAIAALETWWKIVPPSCGARSGIAGSRFKRLPPTVDGTRDRRDRGLAIWARLSREVCQERGKSIRGVDAESGYYRLHRRHRVRPARLAGEGERRRAVLRQQRSGWRRRFSERRHDAGARSGLLRLAKQQSGAAQAPHTELRRQQPWEKPHRHATLREQPLVLERSKQEAQTPQSVGSDIVDPRQQRVNQGAAVVRNGVYVGAEGKAAGDDVDSVVTVLIF